MKLKKIGKLAILTAAGAALITTLINDNREKAKKDTKIEE